MNARSFRLHVVLVIGVYLAIISAGVVLRFADSSTDSFFYKAFVDLVPLAIAVPAAWLGYCFQRRQAYFKDVRELWTKLVEVIQDAIQYTHLVSPPQSEFARVQKSLSTAVDEIRGVFMNLGQNEASVGLYPFESMKDICGIVSKLGFGNSVTPEKSKDARDEIVAKWKKLRLNFLGECSRGIPIDPDTPYELGPGRQLEQLRHRLKI